MISSEQFKPRDERDRRIAEAIRPEEDTTGVDDGAFNPVNLRDRIVIKLLFEQAVSMEQVEEAWNRRKATGASGYEDLWRVLADEPSLDRDSLFADVARLYGFKPCPYSRDEIRAFLGNRGDTFEDETWNQFASLHVLPAAISMSKTGGEKKWVFISHDPANTEVQQFLRSLKMKRYDLCYASEPMVRELTEDFILNKNEYLDRISSEEFAYDLGLTYEVDQETGIDEDALDAEIKRSRLVNLFEAMLIEAVRKGVSDIHIFPNAKRAIEIHFRVDGDLECWFVDPRIDPESFMAVVKDNVMNVDRFERDTAQDGSIQRPIDGTDIRFRVSILPLATSSAGFRSESIVIRVLDDRKVVRDLRQIGLQERAYRRFVHAIQQPYGMVILTGPTGSGKTTTLYASLQQVVSPKRNVLTVEDPVEYILPGVRQIKLSHKLDLEGALRSILRHDPDIVMVGEMRDRPSAELAIKLANTGHLTFSTLHTNDAPSAVSRLYKMGIEPFLIAYAINLIVAQRLVRTLCPECRRPVEQKDLPLLERLGFDLSDPEALTLFTHGTDPTCRRCNGEGYRGRKAISEALLFSNEIRHAIVTARGEIDEAALRTLAVRQGMMTLLDSARERVLSGETSVEEILRVVFTEM